MSKLSRRMLKMKRISIKLDQKAKQLTKKYPRNIKKQAIEFDKYFQKQTKR
jgi:hypothetical protein